MESNIDNRKPNKTNDDNSTSPHGDNHHTMSPLMDDPYYHLILQYFPTPEIVSILCHLSKWHYQYFANITQNGPKYLIQHFNNEFGFDVFQYCQTFDNFLQLPDEFPESDMTSFHAVKYLYQTLSIKNMVAFGSPGQMFNNANKLVPIVLFSQSGDCYRMRYETRNFSDINNGFQLSFYYAACRLCSLFMKHTSPAAPAIESKCIHDCVLKLLKKHRYNSETGQFAQFDYCSEQNYDFKSFEKKLFGARYIGYDETTQLHMLQPYDTGLGFGAHSVQIVSLITNYEDLKNYAISYLLWVETVATTYLSKETDTLEDYDEVISILCTHFLKSCRMVTQKYPINIAKFGTIMVEYQCIIEQDFIDEIIIPMLTIASGYYLKRISQFYDSNNECEYDSEYKNGRLCDMNRWLRHLTSNYRIFAKNNCSKSAYLEFSNVLNNKTQEVIKKQFHRNFSSVFAVIEEIEEIENMTNVDDE